MTFHEKDGLHYYCFDSFPDSVRQAVFTRRGGVSAAPWHSLNLGGSVGDDPAHVAANRVRVFKAMGCDPASIHDVWLVHGTDVVYANRPLPLNQPSPRADIILTDNPAVTLFMRFGDCVPLLFHDPLKKVIGIAHAGWMGTLKGVAGAAVQAMRERYGSNPADLIAGVGPSIGVDHYEVGPEVIAAFREKYPQDTDRLFVSHGKSTHLDLWASNEMQLRQAGVGQVEVSGLCTACDLDHWFSHRAEKGRTGRFGALLALA